MKGNLGRAVVGIRRLGGGWIFSAHIWETNITMNGVVLSKVSQIFAVLEPRWEETGTQMAALHKNGARSL